MKWFVNVLKKYSVIEGRASRKEYWYYTLFYSIFLSIAIGLDNLLDTNIGNLSYGVFYFVYGLVTVVPSTAVGIRRLHDIGKSGWMLFIVLVPIVGPFWLLILLCKKSEIGENKYSMFPMETTEL
jgi:uncharacterized membrane protein YhaH (DUF805 family)